MPIQLEISPKIIPSISTVYTDVNRVFMEYIDNSIDSAEEFFNKNNNSYSKPIIINLHVNGTSHKNGQVIVTDNCTGIQELTRVVNSIGDSVKKTDKFSNGQFGYGIYSYMAFAENLNVTSKIIENDYARSINISRKNFDKSRQKEVQFADPEKVSTEMQSGVKITLSKFEKDGWKQIDINSIQQEIERHFEILLLRKNLSITINYKNNIYKCNSFDYDSIEGEVFPFTEEIKTLTIDEGKRNEHQLPLEEPITIYLKLTKDIVKDKHPVFIKSGRRIAEIKDIKSFKSKNKSSIWSHQHLIGYVDLGTSLDPTIARTDFKNTKKSRAVFNQIQKIEEDILLFIKDINKESNKRHYNIMEDHLNKALSKLAKIDAMNYRTDYLKGNETNLEGGGGLGNFSDEVGGSKDFGGDNKREGDGVSFGMNEGDGLGYNDKNNNAPSETNGDGAANKELDNPWEDSEFKGKERKKSGFNIRLMHTPPPIDLESNKPYRSMINGSQIIIYTKHDDFKSRVYIGRKKEERITNRLITYLAGEITVHYKDRFHNKNGQPDYGKELFIDLVDFVYSFEEALSPLVDKNLSEFSS